MGGADLLDRFSEGGRRFLELSAKEAHSSGMFDMRRRTVIGCYTYFDHIAWALDEMERHSTPEAVGAAGRGLCGPLICTPYHALMWSYLIGRENELGLGRDGGSAEELRRIADWWARSSAAYRGNGTVLPSEDGDRQPGADPEEVLAALEEHGRPAAQDTDYSRVTAALQLYNFVSRGEQRGMCYFHGPYEGRDGATVLVESFLHLRHDEMPWNPDPGAFPLDTVCAVIELEDVALRFDLFQGMVAYPADYRARATRVALVTVDDGEPRPLRADEREQLVAISAREQKRIFREMVGWDDAGKISYGIYIYQDQLVPMLRVAGCGEDVVAECRERFAETARRRLPEVAGVEPVPAWERMFDRGGPLFTPLAESKEAVSG